MTGWYERGHGEEAETLRIVGRETHERGEVLLLRPVPSGPWSESMPRAMTAVQLEADGWRWVELPAETSTWAEGWSCCCRCGRLNMGPCISRTCVDLQTRAA